jgi:hypothetical protein
MGSRQESELMEQLRKVEESEARDRWKNIVHFCRKVRLKFNIFFEEKSQSNLTF